MSEIDPRVDAPPVNWSDLDVSLLLPTGTVTLLLADVEGSTRLWQDQPDEMTAAVARLDRIVADIIAAHRGVRPVEQGEGDSFVVAFARASDAVACALEFQRAPLAPICLRIGVHTGEVQLRDETNYVGPTVNRTARLRDLAHGGQTVLSATTHDLVVDHLPAEVWLTDLGAHLLRDMPRPETVVQLCHPDVRNEFPPLRTVDDVALKLPAQLTSFVGRATEITDVRQLLADNRLVTLTGAGGAGKTRLAVHVAAQIADKFRDGVWEVELAPITDPDIVPVTVARALGLPDQPGRSTLDTLLRFIGDRHMLVVLDNCEHLLDASAALIDSLLGTCPGLTLLATSREPIGVPGEVTWRVPSLSLADEAIELFTDRARRARPDFSINDDEDAASVAEICRRLDGMPLAIELAAARVRAMSASDIVASLHDRFRLLTGGARTAVRRQQTLRASVDWSHALLTEPERVLFRRLAAFMGGFDVDAAAAVCGGGDVERYQVLDQLALLVDKSLVVAEESRHRTRYRLLETVRQYALEKLGESGEADTVRTRHRDYYTSMAALLDRRARAGHEQRVEQAETEIDNLRAAFTWSRENSDVELASRLASSLQPLWLARGRIREGLAWFDDVLADANAHHADVAPAVCARALADKAVLDATMGASDSMVHAEQALAIARDIGDSALLARALTACGCINGYNAEAARPYFAEAIGLARELGDAWMLSQILVWQAYGAVMAGDPIAARAAGEEGRGFAEAVGDRFTSRVCRLWGLHWPQIIEGDLADAVAQLSELVSEAEATHDVLCRVLGLTSQAHALAYNGAPSAARAAADAAIEGAAEVGGLYAGIGYGGLAVAALASGDVAAADEAIAAGWQQISLHRGVAAVNTHFVAQVALARGDLIEARRWADQAVSTTAGWHRSHALKTRARVARAQGKPEQAERDLNDALACVADAGAFLGVPGILECLAQLAGEAGRHSEAARLLGTADAIRQRTGEVRFQVNQAGYDTSVMMLRNVLGDKDFDAEWADGVAVSTDEAIAYAQRGRGERTLPASG